MRVLVTGKNGKLVSYIKKYVRNYKKEWIFEFISLRSEDWKTVNMASYDAVVHCAGITTTLHDNYKGFYEVNVELTKTLFNVFMQSKGKFFIYLSSMAVYDGVGWGFGHNGLITKETMPKQQSNYGKSKFEAEQVIRRMCDDGDGYLKVAIIRAPAIVGGDLEAYFERYLKFSKLPLIPIPWLHIEAKRSFVYIDTLIELICNLVVSRKNGIFYPQNFPQLSVSEIMLEVCKACGKRKQTSTLIGQFIPNSFQKRFFSQICYDPCLTNDFKIPQISSIEAIQRVIKGI